MVAAHPHGAPPVIKPPEHPLGYAFQKAREWEAAQELRLTAPQRETFTALKVEQTKRLEKERERLDAFKAQLAEREKNKRPKAELRFDPPIKTRDVYEGREARAALAAEKRIDTLQRNQEAERIDMLKTFERKRNAPDMTDAWAKAVGKASRDEQSREPKERAKDLER